MHIKGKRTKPNKDAIFFIDPQSMINLAVYDYHLLSDINDFDLYYICSKYLDFKENHNHSYLRVFKYNKLSNSVLKACSYILTYFKLLYLFMTLKPKLVHVQWFRLQHFDLYYYKLAKRLFGFKLLYTAHNILPLNTGDNYFSVFFKIYKLCDAIIVHSEDTNIQLAKKFSISHDKISVIHHGFLQPNYDKSLFKEEEQHFNLKYNFGDKIIFTSLGFQNAYKGCDILAKVWNMTSELNQCNTCILVLVGKNQGVDYSMLSRYKNVIIEDRRLSNEEYYYLLSHTSVYLLPYKKNSFSQSGALMTTISEKIPTLVTNVGGLPEPLKLAKIGWIIEDEINEANLRAALLNILHNPEEIRKIKQDENAWRKVQDFYDWHNISLQTQNLYNKIIYN